MQFFKLDVSINERLQILPDLQLSLASSAAPSRIQTAIRNAETATKTIQDFAVEKEHISGDTANYLADVGTMVKNLLEITGRIDELERYAKYLQWVAKIEDLSSDIQSALIISSVDRSVNHYIELVDLVKQLQESACANLVKFASDTLVFWYKILKDTFSTEFDEVLAAWRWPFIITSMKSLTVQTSTEQKEKLGTLFTCLLRLQLPDCLSRDAQPNEFIRNLPGWCPLLPPLDIMLKPLRKRFRYHFYGNRQTNNMEKPEWYFTQILSWMKDHQEFLRSKIQPLLEEAKPGYRDALVEFSRGLVELAMEKMLSDIPELMYDDHNFSHLIDETLTFDRELRTVHGYPTAHPGCVHVLMEPHAFNKWLTIERKFAQEKMDAILSSPSAWQSLYSDLTDLDGNKVPECAESFTTLLLTITERYKPLPCARHKLQFLDLQLELLDDYRIRLLQMKKEEATDPLGSRYGAILNSVHYVLDVLQQWRELVFFLKLQYYRAEYYESLRQAKKKKRQKSSNDNTSNASLTHQPELAGDKAVLKEKHTITDTGADTNNRVTMDFVTNGTIEEFDISKLDTLEGTVFDETIQLYEHVKCEMLNCIRAYVLDDVKARSRPYRWNKWLALPAQKEIVSLALSTSACEMLLILKGSLHCVEQLLSKIIFNQFWPLLAEGLNRFIYEDVILTNHFNESGAAQLQFDMMRNLFPLFAQYTAKPENYFRDVKEACILLNLSTGSVLLLKEILHKMLHDPDAASDRVLMADPVAALHDIGVFKLTPTEAELVLSLRT
ncbi:RAD50-interacting protein 1 [Lamellibrachia satsuma]|nr:RAD50-interacting protein 1 [Lamellibrachia satsuma]